MRSRVPGAGADRCRLRQEAPQRLGPADRRGRIPAWTRSGLSSQPPRPSLSPTGSGQTIRRSSPHAPPPLTPHPPKPTPTSASNDSLRGPAGCQARSRGAHPAPPAFPGPRSPSSDPRRRGSRLRSLLRQLPRPARAHWWSCAAPPELPNQSPGLAPCSQRGGAAAGGGSREAPPPAAGPASSRPHRYLGSPEILPGRGLRPLAGPGGYGCFPTLCPPAISAWQGQERTPALGGGYEAQCVLGEGRSEISHWMGPRPRAREKGLEW